MIERSDSGIVARGSKTTATMVLLNRITGFQRERENDIGPGPGVSLEEGATGVMLAPAPRARAPHRWTEAPHAAPAAAPRGLGSGR
jgi:hypothetical protein